MKDKKRKILVVNDTIELRSDTTNVLIEAGYQVMEAKNGVETLEKLTKDLPDLILLDVSLPDFNGVEICRQIKSMRFDSPPYVVLSTSDQSTSDDQAFGLEGGADGFMNLPMSKRELLARIESFFRLRNVEDALRESEKELIELNNQKSKVFSIISHDLKAPFNSILGFADILNSELENLDDEELEMSAYNIYASALEANNLLINLLEWAKINWKSAAYTPVHFELEEMVSEIIITYQSIMDAKGIQLKLEIDEDLAVNGDRDMIHSIVRNLVSNAIKFSYVDGTIFISAELNNDEVILKIQDQGMGIKKEDKDKILTPDNFFSTIGTHDEKGSGLGLNICAELINKNKGKIWFSSKEKEGTSFYISLPLAQNKEPMAIKKESKSRDSTSLFKGFTVLVTEDIDHVYRYIEYALKKTGINLIWAKNGKEALDMMKEKVEVDLILMDLSMPVMDGFEATKEIRKINIKTPIIAQSAYNLSGEEQKSLKAGCNDYIQKPIHMDELLNKISNYLVKEKPA